MENPLVVAIITFRDESNFLPACLTSLTSLVDCVIGYDDRSSDSSRDIFLQLAPNPILVEALPCADWVQGGQHAVRSRLLLEATVQGATHVVFIDADEAFSFSFSNTGRRQILDLRGDQKLWLPWVCAWGSLSRKAPETSIWSRSRKDIAMVHDPSASHTNGLFHFGRTPTAADVTYVDVSGQSNSDALIHFQFAFPLGAEIKQIWYMMGEVLAESRHPWEVNYRYRHSIHQDFNGGETLDPSLLPKTLPTRSDEFASWRWQQILGWLDEFGVERFEPLAVWHLPELREIFFLRTGRLPKHPPVWPSLRTAFKWGRRRIWG